VGDHSNNTQWHEQRNKTDVQKCILQLLNLGLLCSGEAPKDRPNMQDVYSEVVAVKDYFLSFCVKETWQIFRGDIGNWSSIQGRAARMVFRVIELPAIGGLTLEYIGLYLNTVVIYV
jgi:hypothetical protein